jgi:hypothetical protein
VVGVLVVPALFIFVERYVARTDTPGASASGGNVTSGDGSGEGVA